MRFRATPYEDDDNDWRRRRADFIARPYTYYVYRTGEPTPFVVRASSFEDAALRSGDGPGNYHVIRSGIGSSSHVEVQRAPAYDARRVKPWL